MIYQPTKLNKHIFVTLLPDCYCSSPDVALTQNGNFTKIDTKVSNVT